MYGLNFGAVRAKVITDVKEGGDCNGCGLTLDLQTLPMTCMTRSDFWA